MMKIINGKRYDTKTAKLVAMDSQGNPSDFGYTAETLYRKTTGEYFLHGRGGPMSRYAETIGQNEWQGGAEIIPLTLESAKKWAEKHMDGDDYEAEFGPVKEDEGKVAVTISLTAGAKEKLKQTAVARGRTISAMVEEWVKFL